MSALNYVPSHTFVLVAFALFTTTGMAVVSMWFALTNGVGIPGNWAWVFAGAWALVIFNLDRLLTQQIGSDQKHVWVAIGLRLFLAALIGTVVSTPLTLKLFEDDIQFQMGRSEQQAVAKIKDELPNSEYAQKVAKLEQRLETLKNEASVGQREPVALNDPALAQAEKRVTDLETSLDTQQELVSEASKLVTCELYGTGRETLKEPNRCSAWPGRKEPYPTYQKELDLYSAGLRDIEQQLSKARQERDTIRGQLADASIKAGNDTRTAASNSLPDVESELKTARQDLDKYRKQQLEDAKNAKGLLSQLKALDDLSRQGGMVMWGHLIIAGLFVLIEMIPVIAKVIMRNKSSMMAYEKAEKELAEGSLNELTHILEKEKLDRAVDLDERKTWRSNERQRIEGMSKADQQVEDDMRARETRLGKQANAYVESHMKLVLDAALNQWSAEAQATLHNAGGAFAGGPSGPQPNQSQPNPPPPNSGRSASASQPNASHGQSVRSKLNMPLGRP